MLIDPRPSQQWMQVSSTLQSYDRNKSILKDQKDFHSIDLKSFVWISLKIESSFTKLNILDLNNDDYKSA